MVISEVAEFVGPRIVPCRDDYYMGKAFWVAAKSKDPSTQVGSVLIGADNFPISTGYNGPPKDIDDNTINWNRPEKYDIVFHSEINAIRYSRDFRLLQDATLYVTGHPCKNCMLHIADSGIKRVVYFAHKPKSGSILCDEENIRKSREIATMFNISLEKFTGNLNWMCDYMEQMHLIGVFDKP